MFGRWRHLSIVGLLCIISCSSTGDGEGDPNSLNIVVGRPLGGSLHLWGNSAEQVLTGEYTLIHLSRFPVPYSGILEPDEISQVQELLLDNDLMRHYSQFRAETSHPALQMCSHRALCHIKKLGDFGLSPPQRMHQNHRHTLSLR